MAGRIIKRREGVFQLIISLGYDENGKQKRVYKTIHVANRKTAEKELATMFLQTKNNSIVDRDISFPEFVEIFKERHYKNIEQTSADNYDLMLQKRILPAFKNFKISNITVDDVSCFLEFLMQPAARLDGQKKKLSSETIRKYYKLLNLIFRKAVAWRVIGNNPCTQIDLDMLPKLLNKHYSILSELDLKKFLQNLNRVNNDARGIEVKLFIMLCLICGTRRGEAGALTWDVIDFKNKTIKIIRSLKSKNGNTIGIGNTKTKSSIRTVFFNDNILELLKSHKKNQDLWLKTKGMRNEQNLVFVAQEPTTDKNVKYFRPAGVYLWLKRFCQSVGIPHICLHSLRAQCATVAASAGTPINLVAAMLGHSDLSTTSIYVHDLLEMRKIASQKVFAKFDELNSEEDKNNEQR